MLFKISDVVGTIYGLWQMASNGAENLCNGKTEPLNFFLYMLMFVCVP
jgi:hypothetical protein